MKISVIVTTYNWPVALVAVLRGFAEQDEDDFEVIIADDGSDAKTTALIEQFKIESPFALHHVWQPDEGFRAAKIRNKAVAQAQGDYLIFLDGDCIPRPSFIRYHRKFAEKRFFVVGNRLLLSSNFTDHVLNKQIPIQRWNWHKWLDAYKQKYCNRWLTTLCFPWLPWRKYWAKGWQGAKTCNLGLWRSDFYAINGLDEHYEGWGYEDSDLIIRLLRAGIRRKEGRFALTVIHLWHMENSRVNTTNNYQRLVEIINSNRIRSLQGIDQYKV